MTHTTHTTLFAFCSVAIACIAWAGVGWIGWKVWNAEDMLSLQVSDIEQITAREASLVRLRTLVRETQGEREILRAYASGDIIHAVQSIESVGRESGVQLEIGSAVQEEAKSAGTILRAISVTVRARGTFSALIHTAALLEILPTPSELVQFQLEKVANTSSDWTLTARVRLLVAPGNAL